MCPKVSMSPAVTGETHWRLEATQGRDRRPHNDVRMLFEAANKPPRRFHNHDMEKASTNMTFSLLKAPTSAFTIY